MAEGLAERYDERIAGILSCYDRIIISGTYRASATQKA
jgi:hypothetical protein